MNIPCSLGSDFKSAAKEIIVLIEKLGMLPPETKALPQDFDNLGFTQDFLDEHEFKVNRWEPEND